jgi:hypothetical protein
MPGVTEMRLDRRNPARRSKFQSVVDHCDLREGGKRASEADKSKARKLSIPNTPVGNKRNINILCRFDLMCDFFRNELKPLQPLVTIKPYRKNFRGTL